MAVFAVSPSTLLLNVPSIDTTPTKIVKITPNIHTTLVLKKLDNLSTCTLSDIFEIIPSDVDISTSGIITPVMKFPIKVIRNSIIGCIRFAETILPC